MKMQPRRSKEYLELMSPAKRHAQMRNEITSNNERLSSMEAGGSPRRGLPKRMDQPRHNSCGRGSDRFPSQMIPHIRKRPRDDDDDEFRRSDCEFCEPGGVSHADANTRLRHVHGCSERELVADRRTPYPAAEYGRSSGKLLALEDGELPTSYCEICASGPSPTQGASRCSEHVKNRPLSVQPYEVREAKLLPRDKISVHPRSHLREFPDYAHRGIRRVSTVNSRGTMLDSYGGDDLLPPTDEFLHDGRSSKSVHASTYRTKVLVDSARNPAMGQNNSSYHVHFQQSGYDSPLDECEEYPYIKQQEIIDERIGYPSNNFRESMAPYLQQRHKHSQGKDFLLDVPRPCKRRSVLDRLEIADGRGDSSKGGVWNRTSLQKHSVRSSFHTLDASQQGGKLSAHRYVHADYGRRQPQNLKAARLGSRMEYRSHVNSENGFEGVANFGASRESYGSAGMHQFHRKPHGTAAGRQIMGEEEMEKEEEHMYISSERIHRDEHYLEEHLPREAYNSTMTRKPNTFEYEDLDGSEDFNDDEEDEGDMCFANSPSDEQEMGEVTYHRKIRQQDFAQEDQFSFQDNPEHEEMHSIRFSIYQGKSIKSHHRSGPVRWYNNAHHNIGRKSGFHRNQKAEMRNDGAYYEDEIANEYDPSKDQENHDEHNFDEESDEFKQLVQEYFLNYSKRININSAVQRRYQAQGKAGSLFCIACGRRFSKEFQDTERLVKHTFMAQRHWLRAKHLGLHRAVCVLLGWSSLTPEDNPTSPPVVLPQAEALSQKEDLIIWPPVFVIHNMSMVIESPEDQKVVSVERVKAFLRGKGLAEGKMVVCLGNPSDQSVMVVKFLGTFSGLRNAQKLHEYFAKNSHGRVEFVDMVSRLTKRSSSGEASELEELNLYGYLGIAEDLDKVDFKTRKFCLIKSNKEINDIENASVKAD